MSLDDLLLDYNDAGASDLMFDSILGNENATLESTEQISSRSLKILAKRKMLRVAQQEKLKEIVTECPLPGEQIHVVSANKFDFWTWVPVMIDWLGVTENLYCSTWTANRQGVVDLFKIWDDGKIVGRVNFVTGLYFKRRETSVYATLVEGLLKRGGRYKAFETHAKVLLLKNEARNAWLTVEGSANLTGNPRLEQYVVTNDQSLYEFHRDWFEEALVFETKLPWGGKIEKNESHTGRST